MVVGKDTGEEEGYVLNETLCYTRTTVGLGLVGCCERFISRRGSCDTKLQPVQEEHSLSL